MKAVVAAFNQEKALVGAFSAITNLRKKIFEALVFTLNPNSAQVTLHSVLGEAGMAPYLDTLTGPKRKLLSLYILRQNQHI